MQPWGALGSCALTGDFEGNSPLLGMYPEMFGKCTSPHAPGCSFAVSRLESRYVVCASASEGSSLALQGEGGPGSEGPALPEPQGAGGSEFWLRNRKACHARAPSLTPCGSDYVATPSLICKMGGHTAPLKGPVRIKHVNRIGCRGQDSSGRGRAQPGSVLTQTHLSGGEPVWTEQYAGDHPISHTCLCWCVSTRVRGDISVDFDEIIGSVKCLNHGFHVGSFSVSCPAFHWCVDGMVPTELDTLVEGGLVTKVTEMLLLGGETHN